MLPDRDRIERAKKELGDVTEVMAAHGRDRTRDGFYSCPFHDDRTPSFHAVKGHPDRYKCFGCDAKGDVLDLEQHLSGVELKELLDELAPDDTQRAREPNPRAAGVASARSAQPPAPASSALEYLTQRGIVDELLIERAQSKFVDGRVWFPWLDAAGEKLYVTGRATNGQQPKYKHSPGPRPPLFASPGAWEVDVVALVEGQLDALACAQAGIPAFATSGSSLDERAVEILTAKRAIIIATDPDAAGNKLAEQVQQMLAGKVELRRVELPANTDLADIAARAVSDGADPAEIVFGVLESAVVVDPGPFRAVPLDWDRLQRDGLPEVDWLLTPYVPRNARIWLPGPAESGKSLWALWVACALSRQGIGVVYVSQENPLVEDVRRLDRLRPEWKNFLFLHDQGFDLDEPAHVTELLRHGREVDAQLYVLDTLTAVWSGNEEDNPSIAAFDRDVTQRIVRESGASVFVLDHTGNPQAFVKRRGVNASRGASSKGQKADCILEFGTQGEHGFTITHAKARIGGRKEPKRQFEVVDLEDGGLDVHEVERSTDQKVFDTADLIVQEIQEAGVLTTKALRDLMKGRAGREVIEAAMAVLKADDPARVICSEETIQTDKGRQRAKVWRPAEVTLLD